MERKEIIRKRQEIEKQLERAKVTYNATCKSLSDELRELQEQCSHPNKIIGGSGDGGDQCEDCGKFWFD